jgi:hypothetical protein
MQHLEKPLLVLALNECGVSIFFKKCSSPHLGAEDRLSACDAIIPQ